MTRGQPPNRLGWTSESASRISKVSKFSSGSKSSEARYQRKIAETELAAAEEIAELERHAEASGPAETLTTSVLGGKEVTAKREHVTLAVEAQDGSSRTAFNAWVLPTVTAPIPAVDWNTQKEQWPHLSDIHFPEAASSTIDVLIGLNAVNLHATLEESRTGAPNDPIARRTPLGWVCFGGGRE